MTHPTQLILFDLGGVLVRICHGWKSACAFNGFTPPAILDDPTGSAALADIGVRFETGRCDEETFIADSAALTGFTRDQVATALRNWLIEPYPGAADLLSQVTAQTKIPTACLSNTNETHWAMMQGQREDQHAAVPLHLLTHRFASHLIGAMKPDPAIYEHVERTLRVDPASILFFDDHPPNVVSARSRGWQVEQIDPTGNSPAQITAHLKQRGLL